MSARIFTTLSFLLIASFPLAADECRDACKQAYEECKSEHTSPNGEKVCGNDYHECERQCAENQ